MDEPLKHERETARQRALRIPLAYHRTRGGVWIWKMLFSLAGVLAGGMYVAWLLAGGKPAATQVSAGTLARDHARWESDCKACHVPFIPQRPDAEAARTLSLALTSGTARDAHHQADTKCSECHKSAGAHHAHQITAEVESCASCHRDHQGRDFLMTRMDDAHCTACHASIAGHITPPKKPVVSNVTAFEVPPADSSSGHPAFHSLQMKEDPGSIRFSHRLHMMLGQLYPGQAVPPGRRLVQLACDACHRPETTTGNGAYMRPIKYEQHCRGCHPLNMPCRPEAVVPHGLASKQLENSVFGILAEEKKSPAKALSPKRLIPGKTPGNNLVDTFHPSPELLATQRLAELRENKCSQCHSWQKQNPVEVQPARIPSVWLEHARFSHKRHQNAAKCLDCHSQAVAKFPASGILGKLADDEEVMIPNIDNCVRCHSPRNAAVGTGGARFDCAECHRYHHPPPIEKPLRGGGLSHFRNGESIPSPESLLVTLVADRAPAQLQNNSRSFAGTQSCSATGCHGSAAGAALATSYARFTTDDPHTRAFLLLYTEPSLEIYRRLTNQPQAELANKAYFTFLDQKCVGCHATSPADRRTTARPESYFAGVSCESCHGPAASWEFTHFNRSAPKSPDFRNLTAISVAATICSQCHIGPHVVSEKSYDVNHELIAAGHPRLTFEFEAQLANLPAHWSTAKNGKSHFEAWRIGELATAAQQDKLHASRPSHEFASHRCFDCHHGLTAKPAASRAAFPPLAVISKKEREWLAASASSQPGQTEVLLKLLGSLANDSKSSSAGTRWEEHVHFSLALAAHVADNPQNEVLSKDASDLREILTNSFHSLPQDRKLKKDESFAGGPYDSPTGFDPNDDRLQQVLQKIRTSLSSP